MSMSSKVGALDAVYTQEEASTVAGDKRAEGKERYSITEKLPAAGYAVPRNINEKGG